MCGYILLRVEKEKLPPCTRTEGHLIQLFEKDRSGGEPSYEKESKGELNNDTYKHS